MSDIVSIMEKQRKFYSTGETLPISFRKEKLRALLASIEKHEAEILAALHEDLNKSSFEGYITEVSIVKDEKDAEDVAAMLSTKFINLIPEVLDKLRIYTLLSLQHINDVEYLSGFRISKRLYKVSEIVLVC